MPRLRFTNVRGASVELYGAPYHLYQWEGLGEVEADIQTSKSPFQNGETYIDTQLRSRHMTFSFTIRGKDEAEVAERRRFISNLFNPLNGLGILEYIDTTGIKQIKAVSTSLPFYPDGSENRGGQFQKCMVNLVAPNPFWRDADAITVRLEDYVGAFSFPFSFDASFAVRGDLGTITNNGHTPTPLKITFYGEAINPQITKMNTGETLRINRTIPAGWKLIVTTDFDNQSAMIVAPDGTITNAMGYIDLSVNWSFFMLDVGENSLNFVAEGGQPEVEVEYRNLYVGV